MKTVIITGSGGLIGAECVRRFTQLADRVIGIDNDMRAYFFGAEGSTSWSTNQLKAQYPNFEHRSVDIRDAAEINKIFAEFSSDIDLVIHTAAQPSHDWAAREPDVDFTVNANGTLVMLEATRKHAPKATFIFTSTNKVYGDRPNTLPLVELEKRWEIDSSHPYFAHGIDEQFSIDDSKHSLFGASKVAADVLAQEYGKYFGMNVGIFRGGCLTGPGHSGAQLHGFLAYLMKCAATGKPYTVFGYKAKQVRDNIHCHDLVSAFEAFHKAPRHGETYNMGGGRFSNCSMIEAIEICEEITGKKLQWTYSDDNRIGDHIWWISDIRKFENHYPGWKLKYDVHGILKDIYDDGMPRWRQTA